MKDSAHGTAIESNDEGTNPSNNNHSNNDTTTNAISSPSSSVAASAAAPSCLEPQPRLENNMTQRLVNPPSLFPPTPHNHKNNAQSRGPQQQRQEEQPTMQQQQQQDVTNAESGFKDKDDDDSMSSDPATVASQAPTHSVESSNNPPPVETHTTPQQDSAPPSADAELTRDLTAPQNDNGDKEQEDAQPLDSSFLNAATAQNMNSKTGANKSNKDNQKDDNNNDTNVTPFSSPSLLPSPTLPPNDTPLSAQHPNRRLVKEIASHNNSPPSSAASSKHSISSWDKMKPITNTAPTQQRPTTWSVAAPVSRLAPPQRVATSMANNENRRSTRSMTALRSLLLGSHGRVCRTLLVKVPSIGFCDSLNLSSLVIPQQKGHVVCTTESQEEETTKTCGQDPRNPEGMKNETKETSSLDSSSFPAHDKVSSNFKKRPAQQREDTKDDDSDEDCHEELPQRPSSSTKRIKGSTNLGVVTRAMKAKTRSAAPKAASKGLATPTAMEDPPQLSRNDTPQETTKGEMSSSDQAPDSLSAATRVDTGTQTHKEQTAGPNMSQPKQTSQLSSSLKRSRDQSDVSAKTTDCTSALPLSCSSAPLPPQKKTKASLQHEMEERPLEDSSQTLQGSQHQPQTSGVEVSTPAPNWVKATTSSQEDASSAPFDLNPLPVVVHSSGVGEEEVSIDGSAVERLQESVQMKKCENDDTTPAHGNNGRDDDHQRNTANKTRDHHHPNSDKKPSSFSEMQGEELLQPDSHHSYQAPNATSQGVPAPKTGHPAALQQSSWVWNPPTWAWRDFSKQQGATQMSASHTAATRKPTGIKDHENGQSKSKTREDPTSCASAPKASHQDRQRTPKRYYQEPLSPSHATSSASPATTLTKKCQPETPGLYPPPFAYLMNTPLLAHPDPMYFCSPGATLYTASTAGLTESELSKNDDDNVDEASTSPVFAAPEPPVSHNKVPQNEENEIPFSTLQIQHQPKSSVTGHKKANQDHKLSSMSLEVGEPKNAKTNTETTVGELSQKKMDDAATSKPLQPPTASQAPSAPEKSNSEKSNKPPVEMDQAGRALITPSPYNLEGSTVVTYETPTAAPQPPRNNSKHQASSTKPSCGEVKGSTGETQCQTAGGADGTRNPNHEEQAKNQDMMYYLQGFLHPSFQHQQPYRYPHFYHWPPSIPPVGTSPAQYPFHPSPHQYPHFPRHGHVNPTAFSSRSKQARSPIMAVRSETGWEISPVIASNAGSQRQPQSTAGGRNLFHTMPSHSSTSKTSSRKTAKSDNNKQCK